MGSPIISGVRSTEFIREPFTTGSVDSGERPAAKSKAEPSPTPAQEVVRLNVHSKAANPELMLLCQSAPASPTCIADISASIEISLGNATIRIANGTDLAILDRILSLVKGTGC